MFACDGQAEDRPGFRLPRLRSKPKRARDGDTDREWSLLRRFRAGFAATTDRRTVARDSKRRDKSAWPGVYAEYVCEIELKAGAAAFLVRATRPASVRPMRKAIGRAPFFELLKKEKDRPATQPGLSEKYRCAETRRDSGWEILFRPGLEEAPDRVGCVQFRACGS